MNSGLLIRFPVVRVFPRHHALAQWLNAMFFYGVMLCTALPSSARAVSTAILDNVGPQRFALVADSGTGGAGDSVSNEVSFEELWLEVRINGQQPLSAVLLLRRNDGHPLVRGENLQRWRLQLPGVMPLTYLDEPYYLLDTLRSCLPGG